MYDRRLVLRRIYGMPLRVSASALDHTNMILGFPVSLGAQSYAHIILRFLFPV
jgi:hypothetical protein